MLPGNGVTGPAVLSGKCAEALCRLYSVQQQLLSQPPQPPQPLLQPLLQPPQLLPQPLPQPQKKMMKRIRMIQIQQLLLLLLEQNML